MDDGTTTTVRLVLSKLELFPTTSVTGYKAAVAKE